MPSRLLVPAIRSLTAWGSVVRACWNLVASSDRVPSRWVVIPTWDSVPADPPTLVAMVEARLRLIICGTTSPVKAPSCCAPLLSVVIWLWEPMVRTMSL